MSRKRQARNADGRERRRQEILEAAERVFDQDGFDKATMERIADVARVSRPLVYIYFPNKSELYLETCTCALGRLRERLLVSVAQSDSGLRQLESILRTHMDFARQQPRCFSVLSRSGDDFIGGQSSNPTVPKAGRTVYALTVECLQRGVDDGSIRADLGDPRLAALRLWGYVCGMAQLSWMGTGLLSQAGVGADRFNADATDFFLRSLQATPE